MKSTYNVVIMPVLVLGVLLCGCRQADNTAVNQQSKRGFTLNKEAVREAATGVLHI